MMLYGKDNKEKISAANGYKMKLNLFQLTWKMWTGKVIQDRVIGSWEKKSWEENN